MSLRNTPGAWTGSLWLSLRELLQAIVSRLIHQIALLDTTLQAAGGAHAGEKRFSCSSTSTRSPFFTIPTRL